jgi:uncharacterized OB-fold protein
LAIVRAAALAEGAWSVAGVPVCAPDEDRFTLLVAAAEMALGHLPPDGPSALSHLTLWGETEADLPERISTALGLGALPSRAVPPEAAALAETLAETSGQPALYLAAETAPGAPARAVALVMEVGGSGGIEMTGADAEQDAPGTPEGISPVGFTVALVRGALGNGAPALPVPGTRLLVRARRLGPFAGEPSWSSRAAPATHQPPTAAAVVEEELATVSEGAYLPLATYLEDLPSRWRFEADRCGSCRTLSFPTRGRCRHCGKLDGLTRERLPKAGGLIEAVTTVRPGAQPSEFDFQVQRGGAYDVVVVRLHPEVRVTLQVTDAPAGSSRIGMAVDTVLRRLYPMEGAWRYGRKAIPRGSPTP